MIRVNSFAQQPHFGSLNHWLNETKHPELKGKISLGNFVQINGKKALKIMTDPRVLNDVSRKMENNLLGVYIEFECSDKSFINSSMWSKFLRETMPDHNERDKKHFLNFRSKVVKAQFKNQLNNKVLVLVHAIQTDPN